MDALYQLNTAKFNSKGPNDKLVGSKRSHEDSDESSFGEEKSKSKF